MKWLLCISQFLFFRSRRYRKNRDLQGSRESCRQEMCGFQLFRRTRLQSAWKVFQRIGSIGIMGLLRRIQSYRARSFVGSCTTDSNNSTGDPEKCGEVCVRRHNFKVGSDLQHIHHDESRLCWYVVKYFKKFKL